MWTTLNIEGRSKSKKRARDISKGTLDIEFERDWSVGLGAMLGNGHKIKNYFSSFKDFSGKIRQCHIVEVWMYNKPTNFDENRWSHFGKMKFFFLCELLLTLRYSQY